MEALFSLAGVVGAVCCVGMYAAVSFGRASAECPAFFIVNGIGALLIMLGAWHSFDLGDIGTIGQEITWALVSLIGAARAWRNRPSAPVAGRVRRTGFARLRRRALAALAAARRLSRTQWAKLNRVRQPVRAKFV